MAPSRALRTSRGIHFRPWGVQQEAWISGQAPQEGAEDLFLVRLGERADEVVDHSAQSLAQPRGLDLRLQPAADDAGRVRREHGPQIENVNVAVDSHQRPPEADDPP
jgi:hypothetical protein